MSKKGLGKGLGALLSEVEIRDGEQVQQIELRLIRPNPRQPRKTFDQAKLEELALSISEHGIVQPIVVRPRGSEYEIVAGERRWRAAEMANLKTVPAIVRDFSEAETMEIALIENLQREDLNPIEEARAYKALIEQFGLTQDELAARLGKSRPQITNTLRLLQLTDKLQQWLLSGELSMGHAKVLLSLNDQRKQAELAEKAVSGQLSVRALESMTKASHGRPAKRARVPKRTQADLADVASQLSEALGAPVAIHDGKPRGTIAIHYFGHDDLARIVDLLLEGRASAPGA